jgi:hypothetical protein
VGLSANSPRDIFSEIRGMLQGIPKWVLVLVYDEWITEHKEKYYHRESKKSDTL